MKAFDESLAKNIKNQLFTSYAIFEAKFMCN